MRINSGVWEVSYDGGTTYTSTGISALGKDGITPKIRINSTSLNWETSIDGGTTWLDTGVSSKTTSASVTGEMIGNSDSSVVSQKAINNFLHLAKGIDLSEVSERGGVDLYTGSLISSTTGLRYELSVNSDNNLTITYNNIRTDGHTIKISWCCLDSSKSNPDHVYFEGITISGETKIIVPDNRPYIRFFIREYSGSTQVEANLSEGELVLNNGIENLVVQEHGLSTEKTVSQYGISKIAYGVFDQEDRLIYEDTSGVIHKIKYTTAPTSLYDLGIVNDATVRVIYAVPDVSKMTDLCFGFSFQENLEFINLKTWDTGNVTKISDEFFHGLFANCTNLTELDFSTWDWSKVTGSMNYFLASDTNLKKINFGTFDMGNITTFHLAFHSLEQLTTIIGTLSNIKLNISFDRSPLTEASAMVIINGLADLTSGTSQTLTLSSTTKALLTDADKLIATNKNWVIA
jgi:surface protein